jgi:cyclic pyranopterin phosphate synthase
MLKDQFGREFSYLRLSVTDKCNYRCQYCLPDGYQKPDMPVSELSAGEIIQLASAFVESGIEKIRVTGGEPSLRKDLLEILCRLKSIDGLKKLAVTTNGYRLLKDWQDWHRAGVDQINISIDSLNREKFTQITGHDHLPRILEAIGQISANTDIKLKVNAVLMKDLNQEDFSDFVEFVRGKNISVRFIEVMQTQHQATFFAEHHLRGTVLQDYLLENGWQLSIRNKSDGPALEYWHPNYQGRIGLIMPYSKDFCSSCNRLRLDHQGRMHLCLFADDALDLRAQLDLSQVELITYMQALLAQKTASHLLHKGDAGHTKNLSAIGG